MKTVSCKFKVDDNCYGHHCHIIGSVRNHQVSLRIEGGPQNWAHLDRKQVERLGKYLEKALGELGRRGY